MKTGFGWVEIQGKMYHHDVVIHAGGAVSRRPKTGPSAAHTGHTPLTEGELEFLERERPEVVYVGTGQYGAMPLEKGAAERLSRFETVVRPTPSVLPLIERERRRFAAILHVTC